MENLFNLFISLFNFILDLELFQFCFYLIFVLSLICLVFKLVKGWY